MNDYENTHPYYDSLISRGYGDKRFYLRYAGNNMRILDAGCGTGRISLYLARKRKNCIIEAIDISEGLLGVFRSKLDDVRNKLYSEINIHKMDMKDITLEPFFDLVIFPFQSFQVLFERQDQINVLKNLFNLINENGKIIISIFDPLYRGLDFKKPATILHCNMVDPFSGDITICYDKNVYIDYEKATYHFTKHLMIFDTNGIIKDEREDKFCVALLPYKYMEELLEKCGFIIKKLYKNYNFSPYLPYEKSFDVIFVLKKKV